MAADVEHAFEVIVVGGGPAGSTASTLLAQQGHKVLMLEQGQHPRFHIGESMLPQAAPVMKRLGIDWSCDGLAKGGADFLDEQKGLSAFFPLADQFQAFQLERSAFDQKLFLNAARSGVEVRENEAVHEVTCSVAGVTVVTEQAHYAARYLIDATGRRALMGRKQKTIDKLGDLGRFAVYQHYQKVNATAADELFDHGNVQIILVDMGWLWVIPLTRRRLSVGLVVQQEKPAGMSAKQLFQHYIGDSDKLSQWMSGAEALNPVQVEADFSYINQQRYGVRYACCGDAAGFLDPVFSSGVFFALKTAEQIADRLHPALLEGCEADPRLHALDDEMYETGFQTMHLMIKRFYQSGLVQNLFFDQQPNADIKAEVTAILGGDLWSGNNLFQQGLLRGRRKVA